MARDVTAVKRTEQALQESGRFLRALMGSMRAPSVLLDTSSYTISAANEEAARAFGYAAAELRGLPWRQLHATETSCDTFIEAARETVARSRFSSVKSLHLRRRDGSAFTAEASIVVVPGDGRTET